MDNYNERIIEGIKRTMKLSRKSMKALSEDTGIPYRSIQNYLSGSTRMPADVYVQILEVLGVDNQYILYGNFHLKHWPLWDSLWQSLGDSLVNTEFKPDTGFPDDMAFHNRKQAAALDLMERLSKNYDEYSEKYLKERYGKLETVPERYQLAYMRHSGSQ